MKVVINKCYGGFSLSPYAVKRMAEMEGRPCFFFRKENSFEIIRGKYVPCSPEEAEKSFMWWAFDIPNPNEVFEKTKEWQDMTPEERTADNELYKKHQLENRPGDRSDAHLVQAVEELGERADGSHATLKVVEIPDGVEYEIQEYDGIEWVAEAHRTWS